jgi:hypothetical protein
MEHLRSPKPLTAPTGSTNLRNAVNSCRVRHKPDISDKTRPGAAAAASRFTSSKWKESITGCVRRPAQKVYLLFPCLIESSNASWQATTRVLRTANAFCAVLARTWYATQHQGYPDCAEHHDPVEGRAEPSKYCMNSCPSALVARTATHAGALRTRNPVAADVALVCRDGPFLAILRDHGEAMRRAAYDARGHPSHDGRDRP